MGRLRVHREKVCGLGSLPVGPWLDLHDPDATARHGLTIDVDDEARKPVRLHLRPRPVAERAIRPIEAPFRELRDVLPPAAAGAGRATPASACCGRARASPPGAP